MDTSTADPPPTVPQLRERRDKAKEDFQRKDKSFHDKVNMGKFANTEESLPGYEEVQAAFDDLCAAQGELEAVTGKHGTRSQGSSQLTCVLRKLWKRKKKLL